MMNTEKEEGNEEKQNIKYNNKSYIISLFYLYTNIHIFRMQLEIKGRMRQRRKERQTKNQEKKNLLSLVCLWIMISYFSFINNIRTGK